MNLQEVIDAINEEWEKKLEEIRAEIEKLQTYVLCKGDTKKIELADVLEILDKYKAEGEPPESEDNK